MKYRSPEMDGKVIFRFDNNNGAYVLGNGEYSFDTRWSRAGNDSIHAYGLLGFDPAITAFPSIEELPSLDISSRSRTIRTGQIVVFENMKHHFVAIKLGKVYSSGHGFPYDEMSFEYHIYNIT